MKSSQNTPDTRAPEPGCDPTTPPTRLRWTDPEDGGTLWVELWGSREFVEDLVAQGFEVRPTGADETASSLCVRIEQRSAPRD